MRQSTAFESYKSCRDKLAICKQCPLAAARAAFLAGCQALFKANSELRSFGWHECGDGSLSTHVPDINGHYGIDLESEGDEQVCERQLQEVVAEFLGWFNEDDLRALLKEEAEVIIERDSLPRR